MARAVKEEEYAEKRNAILDVAQKLIYTRGFEQMTIQDILNELHISKGAFYHYFDSKTALVEGILERYGQSLEQLLQPIARDTRLSALEKLQRFYDTLNRRKLAEKDFLLTLAPSLYTDHNALFRQKLIAEGLKWHTSLLTEIIQQGVQEGVLTTPYPDEAGKMIAALIMDLGETIMKDALFIGGHIDIPQLQRMERLIAAYSDAFEKIIGAPSGSLVFFDFATFKKWLSPQESKV